MTTWLANARETFKSQLWPIPTIAVIAALLLGIALPRVEAGVTGQLSAQVNSWLFGGDAGAARSLLGAIASSLITVTSLTFSLTVVTLQLASGQFSPRLLRTFTSDQFVQGTLALFLATFTYALTVLRAVRSAGGSGQSEFVPKFSVTVAFMIAIASVLGLVLFLAHLAAQIRVETMLRTVHHEATTTMRTVLDGRDTASRALTAPAVPSHALPLLAHTDGFMTWIEQEKLCIIATDEDAVVSLQAYPGRFLVKGTPLGAAWSSVGGALDGEAASRIADRIADCIHIGFERTAAQDVGHGLRQLVDVANKALSPGINDPTTAIHALGHISAFLCDLSDCDLGTKLLWDEDDTVRVSLLGPDLAKYVDLGISQPRRYGASDPQVLEKIFQVLLDLTYRVAPDQHQVVIDQLQRLRRTVQQQSFDSVEVEGLAQLGRQIERKLGASGVN